MGSSGEVFFIDWANHRIRKIGTDGVITTVVGTGVAGYSGDQGPGTAAAIDFATGLALDSSGNLFIADYGNNRVRKLAANGIITTVAGNGNSGSTGDGTLATNAAVGVSLGSGHRR